MGGGLSDVVGILSQEMLLEDLELLGRVSFVVEVQTEESW